MLSQLTLRIFCIFLSVAQFARLEAAQDSGYGDFLQRIRNGDAPVSSNQTSSDWVYSSQSSAFEVALRKAQETIPGKRTVLSETKAPTLTSVKNSTKTWGFLDIAGACIFSIVLVGVCVLAICCFCKCIRLTGSASPVIV